MGAGYVAGVGLVNGPCKSCFGNGLGRGPSRRAGEMIADAGHRLFLHIQLPEYVVQHARRTGKGGQ